MAAFVAGLVPAFMPGRCCGDVVGIAFFAADSPVFATKKMARPAATMLGVSFSFLVALHSRIVPNSRDGNEWTRGFVALAMIFVWRRMDSGKGLYPIEREIV